MLTMQTPGSEVDLVRGILFTEGVYKNRKEHLHFEVLEEDVNGFISKLNVLVDAASLDTSQINKRNLLSVASCGICGRTELFQTTGVLEEKENQMIPSLELIRSMMAELQKLQVDFKETGGTHAASIATSKGELLVVKEDIGRHNAVDKCIGNLLNNQQLELGKYLLVSGRVSYEIVVKCFSAGIPVLIAVSAPSSLAVDFAKELGIRLIAFTRDQRFTQYS